MGQKQIASALLALDKDFPTCQCEENPTTKGFGDHASVRKIRRHKVLATRECQKNPTTKPTTPQSKNVTPYGLTE